MERPPLSFQFKHLLLAATIPIVAVLVYGVGRWQIENFSYVPEKRMLMDGQDVKNGRFVFHPVRGDATILSQPFTITFVGEQWTAPPYEMTLVRSPGYQIDGRRGGILSMPDEVWNDDMGNNVGYSYDPRKRAVTITFKKQRFVYCDYKHTLVAGGKSYSTGNATVHLQVAKDGKISQWAGFELNADLKIVG